MNDAGMYDVLLEIARKRRTIRRFKPDPIPDEFITKIIDVARWAPSGFHTQPWEFVVINEKELRQKIVGLLQQYGPPIRNPNEEATEAGRFDVAPVFIILLGDWRAKVGLPDAAQSSDARVDGLFRTSLANAFLSMQLAATSLGLASQWYSAVSGEHAQSGIKALIGIPEGLRHIRHDSPRLCSRGAHTQGCQRAGRDGPLQCLRDEGLSDRGRGRRLRKENQGVVSGRALGCGDIPPLLEVCPRSSF